MSTINGHSKLNSFSTEIHHKEHLSRDIQGRTALIRDIANVADDIELETKRENGVNS